GADAPPRHDVGQAVRVIVRHSAHGPGDQSEQGDLRVAEERRAAALDRQILERAYAHPRRLRGPRVVDRRHRRTSSVVPAIITDPDSFSSAEAGRTWPRSCTYASDGSGVSGAFTNE